MSLKKITILGSTGSVGKAALEIIRKHPQEFMLEGISAAKNKECLINQIREFKPRYAVLAVNSGEEIKLEAAPTKLMFGEDALCELAEDPAADIVLIAIVGVAALLPAYKAILAGKTILLANKEALVCAGEILTELAKKTGAKLLPVDSEHSAIYQLLQSKLEDTSFDQNLRQITLTASGGPFLNKEISELENVTPEDAVKHPRWNMGAKISIDSATMVNKALEIAEARWLFNVSPAKIRVIVHPESIVHGLVEFIDGTFFAHLSVADMKGPIAYALGLMQNRFSNTMRPLKLEEVRTLNFLELDRLKFRAPDIMFKCLESGGAAPAVFNCANDIAVDLFIARKIKFPQIVETIENYLTKYGSVKYASIDDIISINNEMRNRF